MKLALATIATTALIAGFTPALHAQTPPAPRFDGTLILMTGQAELEIANDEAVASFYVEVQDADLAKAQSQVNQRVAEATGILKRSDPKGEVQSSGYSSYPVYRNDSGRKIVGWRVRQGVTLRTGDLGGLARTVAAVQPLVALGGIEFRLSRSAREKVEGELIQRAIANLNSRVAAVAQSLNVPAARIRTEELNFGVHQIERPQMMSMARAAPMAAESVAEPQFEAGRSSQQMTVTAKVRFLQP
jgi:uncharacterized protein YggE